MSERRLHQANAAEVFARLADIPHDELDAALDRECAGDPELRAEVARLVRADRRTDADSVLARHLRRDLPTAATFEIKGHQPGSKIGRYVLLDVIGEGGFGVVYLAEQTEPVRRRVALKLIKPGMDSRAVVGRFEAERQALAVMEHPNVAQILDGGSTEHGLPYFVMELVKGLPITHHCDRQRLTLEERVELFARVCDAVQHAHQKGIIHRDLKPSNILVEYRDGVSTPKIIDFGVAKALNQQLAESSVFTREGRLIGTPEYMSPEQAEMSMQDIDTRSDVYSLGVLLYELLTGMRPFDLRRVALEEMCRYIREVDPPRPSTKLSTLNEGADADTASHIATARRAQLGLLSKTLRRDLDWVVMRCLEKDRERRYPTAEALATELRRFLEHKPVEAGPPNLMYRGRKFLRRHGTAVGVVALTLALLVTGLISTTWQWQRAERAAAAEEQTSTELQAFTVDVLGEVHDRVLPLAGSVGARKTLVEVAIRQLEALERRVADDPSLLPLLADGYDKLGDLHAGKRTAHRGNLAAAALAYDRADRLLNRALAEGLSDLHAQSARIQLHRGDIADASGRPAVAIEHFEEGLALLSNHADDASEYVRVELSVALANAISDARGASQRRRALLSDALARARGLVDRSAHAGHQRLLARAHHNLGELALLDEGNADSAASHFEDAVAHFDSVHRLRPTDTSVRREVAGALMRWSIALIATGRQDEALRAIEHAAAHTEFLHDADPDDMDAILGLGRLFESRASVHAQIDRTAEEELDLVRAVEASRLLLRRAPDHIEAQRREAICNYRLARIFAGKGAYGAAVAAARDAFGTFASMDSAAPGDSDFTVKYAVRSAQVWSYSIEALNDDAHDEEFVAAVTPLVERWSAQGVHPHSCNSLREWIERAL